MNLDQAFWAFAGVTIGALFTFLKSWLDAHSKKETQKMDESSRVHEATRKRVEVLEQTLDKITQENFKIKDQYFREVTELKDKCHEENKRLSDQIYQCKLDIKSCTDMLKDILSRPWFPEEEKKRYRL